MKTHLFISIELMKLLSQSGVNYSKQDVGAVKEFKNLEDHQSC